MLVIRCSKCKSKLFKYMKIGSGRILNCWYDKITKKYCIEINSKAKCKCGNTIGIAEAKGIRMKSRSFTESGTRIKK